MERFYKSLEEFNSVDPIGSMYENSFRKDEDVEKLVHVVCYCLNWNHYHLILEELREGGISEFMKRLGGGYTWHYNNKYKRSGSLFQGRYKSVHINTNEYLLHVSVYVNLNNRVHAKLGGSTAKLPELYKSSWGEYIKTDSEGICEKEIILSQFKNYKEYKIFAEKTFPNIVDRKAMQAELELLGG